MLDEPEQRCLGRPGVIFEALGAVRPSELAYPLFFDRTGLAIGAVSPQTTPKPLDLEPVRRFNAGAVTLGAMNGRR